MAEEILRGLVSVTSRRHSHAATASPTAPTASSAPALHAITAMQFLYVIHERTDGLKTLISEWSAARRMQREAQRTQHEASASTRAPAALTCAPDAAAPVPGALPELAPSKLELAAAPPAMAPSAATALSRLAITEPAPTTLSRLQAVASRALLDDLPVMDEETRLHMLADASSARVDRALQRLRRWLRKQGMRSAVDVFRTWDRNSNFQISQMEFRDALAAHGFHAPVEAITALFDAIDTDANYQLSFGEVRG